MAFNSLIKTGTFHYDGKVYIPSDTMARFVEELKDRHDRVGEVTDVPIYDNEPGPLRCALCNFRTICIKAGNGGGLE